MKYVKALVWMFLLFLGVYLPSFILVGIVRTKGPGTVLLIIVASLLVAALTIAIFLLRHGWQRRDFGLILTGKQYLIGAFILGGVFGLIVAVLQRIFGVSGPETFQAFPFWQIVLLFWVCASIQEELIFRGLIQSVVGRTLGNDKWGPISAATVIVALLFAVIHIPMGIFAVGSAFFVGLLAGEIRTRSSSILPAIIVHAMMNITGTI